MLTDELTPQMRAWFYGPTCTCRVVNVADYLERHADRDCPRHQPT